MADQLSRLDVSATATDNASPALNSVTKALNAQTAAVVENAAQFDVRDEKVTRSTQSTTQLVNKYNALERAQNNLSKATREGNAAIAALTDDLQAGVITQEQYNGAVLGLSQRLDALRQKVLAARDAQAAMDGTVRDLAESAAAAARGISAAINSYGDSLENLRRQYDPVYAASKRYEEELERIQRAEGVGAISASTAAAARDRLTASYDRQYSSLDRIKDALQAETAAAEQSAQMQRQQADELDRVRAKYDSVFAVSKRYENELKAINAAEQSGAISSRIAETARARAAEGLRGTSTEVEKLTNKFGLAGWQMRNLTAQFVDFGVQISTGQGLFYPLIQQGPQAIDAAGGLRKSWELLTAVLTPARLLIAGIATAVASLAAGLIATAVSAERSAAALARVQTRLSPTRPDAVQLAPMVVGAARGSASTTDISTPDALTAGRTIAASPNFSGDQDRLQKLIDLSQKIGKVMGTDAADGAKRLAEAMNQPDKAAKDLAEQGIGGLTDKMAKNIETMTRHGQVAAATALVIDAYTAATKNAAETDFTKSVTEMTAAFTQLWNILRPISDFIGGTLVSVITRLNTNTAWSINQLSRLLRMIPGLDSPESSSNSTNVGPVGGAARRLGEMPKAPSTPRNRLDNLLQRFQDQAVVSQYQPGADQDYIRELLQAQRTAKQSGHPFTDRDEARLRKAFDTSSSWKLTDQLVSTSRQADGQEMIAQGWASGGAAGAQDAQRQVQALADAWKYAGTVTGDYSGAVKRLKDQADQLTAATNEATNQQTLFGQRQKLELQQAQRAGASPGDLAGLQARQDLEARGIDTTSASSQKIIDNAKTISMNDAQISSYKQLKQVGVDAFESIEDAAMKGTLTFKSLLSVLESIAMQIIKMAINQPLQQALGLSSGSGSVSGSSVFSSLGSAISSLFGDSTVTTANLDSSSAFESDLYSGQRASGGPVTAGTTYLTGEEGPELFTPTTNGSIASAAATASSNPASDAASVAASTAAKTAAATSGNGLTVNVHTLPGTTAQASQSKGSNGQNQLKIVMQQVEQHLAGAIARGGTPVNKSLEGRYGVSSAAGIQR